MGDGAGPRRLRVKMTLQQIIEAYEEKLLSIGEALVMANYATSVELYERLRNNGLGGGTLHFLTAGPLEAERPRDQLLVRIGGDKLVVRFRSPD